MNRQCKKCLQILPITEFYNIKTYECKECTKKRMRKTYWANREYYREYDKNRMYDPKRIQAREKYRKTEAGKKAVYQATKNYRDKYPERQKIYRDCEKVLKNPHICSQCGSEILVEAHHDDYNKPFVVRWLCRKCHRQWHKNNEPIKKS